MLIFALCRKVVIYYRRLSVTESRNHRALTVLGLSVTKRPYKNTDLFLLLHYKFLHKGRFFAKIINSSNSLDNQLKIKDSIIVDTISASAVVYIKKGIYEVVEFLTDQIH